MADDPKTDDGEITDEKTSDQQDHQALLDSTESALAKFRKANDDDDDDDADVQLVDKPDGTPEDEKPEGDEKPDEKPDGEVQATDDGGDEKPDAAKVDDEPTEPTLPAAYQRSLKAFDWSNEEIAAGFKQNPDKFLEFAEKIHRSRNKQTAEFAEAGRRARGTVQKPSDGSQTATEIASAAAEAKGLKLINKEDLIERFGGNEEQVNAIIDPVNEVIGQINAVLPELQDGVRRVKRSTEDTLAKEIESFFTSSDMEKTFGGFYGSLEKEPLSEDQQDSRSRVLELADAIVSGAMLQNREMSVAEALLAAHDSVASDLVASKVREDIKKAVTKRSASITLKPGSGGESPTGDSRPSTRKELEAKARKGLAAAFGS